MASDEGESGCMRRRRSERSGTGPTSDAAAGDPFSPQSRRSQAALDADADWALRAMLTDGPHAAGESTSPQGVAGASELVQCAAGESTPPQRTNDPHAMRAPTKEERTALRVIRRRLAEHTAAEVEAHVELVRLRHEQWAVAGVSEVVAGGSGIDVELPPTAIWHEVHRHCERVDVALAHEDLGRALGELHDGARAFERCHRRVWAYAERVHGGAAQSVVGLELAVTVGNVAATALAGGGAVTAARGLVAIAAASGAGAAGSTLVYGAARAGREYVDGVNDTQWNQLLRRAGSDGITTLAGALIGGPLAAKFISRFSGYLGRACSEEILVGIGWARQLGKKMPREFFVGEGKRAIAEFIAGLGSEAFTGAVAEAYERAVGERDTSVTEFAAAVAKQAAQGMFLQGFIGFLARRQGRAMEEYTRFTERKDKGAIEYDNIPNAAVEGGVGGTREAVEGGKILARREAKILSPIEAERLQVAETFYKSHGVSGEPLSQQLKGIDYDCAVQVKRFKKGTVLYQYQVPGAPQGSYYSATEVDPLQLGIAHRGRNRATGEYDDKLVTRWVLEEDVDVLVSTAAPVKDTWSIPGLAVQTAGGVEQLYMPQREKLSRPMDGSHE